MADFIYAQTAETQKLLSQAEHIVFYNPKEANAIAEHTLKLPESRSEKAKSFYIKALSFYVMGKYDLALVDAFEAEKWSKKANENDVLNKSTSLIQRIFNGLQLKDESRAISKDFDLIEPALKVEDYLLKSRKSLNANHLDSSNYYLKKAIPFLDLRYPGYADVLFNGMKGKISFKQQQFDSANIYFLKAIEIGKDLDNPFIDEKIYRSMAASYLAIDSIPQFQLYNEELKLLDNQINDIENKASNQAHTLVIASYDRDFNKSKSFYSIAITVLVGLICLVGICHLVFLIRNQNKLKMINRMMTYLQKQENLLVNNQTIDSPKQEIVELEETIKPEIETEEVVQTKTVSILKESEDLLLQGLEKFEASKRFTNKDMSLGKLAAQLGTNTKYLSEVINRNKEKNFNSYINELRINYITNKIKSDSNYLNYKVSYLAEECGFSSHSTFATVFKSIVGVSPSLFVEFVREELQKEIQEVE